MRRARVPLVGAMLFGAPNAFWSNLIFFFETPRSHYGERAAGLAGICGLDLDSSLLMHCNEHAAGDEPAAA